MNLQVRFLTKNLMTGLHLLCLLFLSTFASAQAETAVIAGFVTNEFDDPIENVAIVIGGDAAAVVFTDAAGFYQLELPEEGDYTVSPLSDNFTHNGVTTLDAVLIGKHIDGSLPLTSPYQLLAADVNNSQDIDMTDTMELMEVILQISDQFLNNNSWRFIDAGYQFPNPQNPWFEAFPEIVNINNLTDDQFDVDFIGIKIGDVNNSNSGDLNFQPCDISCGFISGNVFFDDVENCMFDAGETPLQQWIVKATSDNDSYTVVTNSAGAYYIPVIPDDYEITLTPANPLWEACTPSVMTTVAEDQDVVIDFPVQAILLAPSMEADLGTAFLRPCFLGFYAIEYCNQGTVVANGATMEVTFDPAIEVQSSEPSWSEIDGDTYIYDLGDVGISECHTIEFVVFIDCDIEVGQVLCSEAEVFPESSIPAGSSWDGSDITLAANCDGDQVRFEIRNAGEPMTDQSQFFVVEDDMIMMTPAPTIQLNTNEIEELIFPANGSTYRVEVWQSSDHPLNERLSEVVEACGTNGDGTFSMGFANNFPHYSRAPTVDKDCVETIGSYDPNDKRAVPSGVHDAHFIERNTDLEYTIRFQNTGTAPAVNVVLLDTLSEFVNLETVRAGVSSHDYNFHILDGNVLQFVFPDIMLPDSNENEALSHGFVQFKISQQIDNPLGTVIENDAAIYFDFNDPIITNTAYHTVGENFLEVVSNVINRPDLKFEVSVFPNPVGSGATLFLDGTSLSEGQFELYDLAGRMIHTQSFSGSEIDLANQSLSKGLYIFKILENNTLMSNGKLFVK